jgi:hypothetical protein
LRHRQLRATLIDIRNDVVDGRPGHPHYVAGTYEDNGVKLTPAKHLGNKVIADEKRGIVTPSGTHNALIICGDRFRQIRRDLLRAEREYRRLAAERVRSP